MDYTIFKRGYCNHHCKVCCIKCCRIMTIRLRGHKITVKVLNCKTLAQVLIKCNVLKIMSYLNYIYNSNVSIVLFDFQTPIDSNFSLAKSEIVVKCYFFSICRTVLDTHIEKRSLLKSPHIYKKHQAQYEIRTHGRMVQVYTVLYY